MTSGTRLGGDLSAFILEHEYRGELDAAVETDPVWMTCGCGAGMEHALEPSSRETAK